MSFSENKDKDSAEPKMTGHLKQASSTLSNFLESGDDRVFVLKGPYGAGKSFFLRWFLGSTIGQESAIKLRFLSYVSVFGVNDLKELQNVMVGSITFRKLGDSSLWKTSIFDKALNLLQKGISPILGGLNLELSAGSAIWAIAKHQGLLLVIDDVDRKGSQLQLESIIGFANSLAEHTEGRTKVIFVLNEEQFADDDSALWSRLREKFIDNEFRFHPSPGELAGLFIDDDSVRDLIGRIHTRLIKPNIRSMRKIQSMVHRLTDYLKSKQVGLDQSEVDHVVRCAALYLHSGVPIIGEDLFRIYSKNWYVRDSDPPTEQEKSLYELMETIEFGPDSNLDPMCIAFFRDGAVDPELLSAFEKKRMDEQTRERFEKDQTAFWACYNANFLDTKDEFIHKSKDFLETYRDIISSQDLATILGVLDALDVDVTDEWRSWLQPRLSSLTHESIRRLRLTIPESLHPLLEAREDEFDATIDPTIVFRDLYENDSFGAQETIARLAKWTEADFLKWFSECDDSNLISQLRNFLSFVHGSGDLQTIKLTLSAALIKQAEASAFNEIRIRRFFGNVIKNDEPPQQPLFEATPKQ